MNEVKAGPVAVATKALLTLMYGVPIVWILITSIKSSADVFDRSATFVFTPTLDAYAAAITPALWQAMGQSATIAIGTTALVLAVAIPAAYGLARTTGWAPTVGLGLLIVLQMMPQTANVIPLFQIFSSWRLLDTTAAVILADAALLVPFATLLLRPFFRAVPPELEEAASIDGAGIFRTFWRVVLPVARNGLFTVGTLIFLLAWGEFLYAVNFYLTPSSYPLSALLAQQVSAFGIDWPGLMALAVLTSLPILVVFSLTYRQLKDGLTVGAVK
ncbi:carbohydrate ABC transporter permease [Cellulomonas shaoxiangyii]|uniref:Carbohydrate ABC transporter permease n=1 Tax=Cellulomonas shaoxiangyii TaxID=2566013 RepID=A0A4P7SJF9_9CELL|nr:carbohydrate ABC transporter permease [Cellulomonas shaoxiangyii]QCB94409.1 carbohydrate ABC transporter permease [Cellulomonas shaoxiangyii]TGY80170.1 carbohydrate ABC transporter permease [Cellulomonas shaoxiangyii]